MTTRKRTFLGLLLLVSIALLTGCGGTSKKQLKNELKNVESQNSTLEKELSAKDESIASLTEEISKKDESIVSLKEEISKKDETITDLNSQISNLTTQTEELKNQATQSTSSNGDFSKLFNLYFIPNPEGKTYKLNEKTLLYSSEECTQDSVLDSQKYTFNCNKYIELKLQNSFKVYAIYSSEQSAILFTPKVPYFEQIK